VQIEGQEDLVLACCTLSSDGMKVQTETEPVIEARKIALMHILAKHPHACLLCAQKEGCTTEPCSTNVPLEERCCPKFGNCELERVAEYIGIREDTPRYIPENLPIVKNEPLFLRDYNLCIGCTRCVRVCQEIRGVEALGFVYKEGKVFVGTVKPSLIDSNCRFCGACVELCPTGALRDKELKATKREADLIPCKYACPLGVDVPRYLRLITEGKFSEAAAVIREKLPLPNVLAHACSRQCESVCRRGEVNETISICGLKRFALENDQGIWKEKMNISKPTVKKIAVIGSGPAGLAASYYLRRLGHSVIVFEAMPEPGGMMRYGVQEYRLPEEIVKNDIQEIVNLGVKIKTGISFGKDLTIQNLKDEGFHATLIAVGLQNSRMLKMEGINLDGVVGGLDFLKKFRIGEVATIKGRVLVIGGGNVAMDVALTALRLGAASVQVSCLEKTDEMPAFPWEVEQALEEGVMICNRYGIKKILEDNGHVKAVELMQCLSVFDEKGRFHPKYNENKTQTIETDVLILAIGQSPDPTWQTTSNLRLSDLGLIHVNPATMETNITSVFACGDIAEGQSSIVEALASGKKAAFAIDKRFGGPGIFEDRFVEVEEPNPWLGKVENFAHKKSVQMPCLPVERRLSNFYEIELGYNEKMAMEEVNRCLRCDLRMHFKQPPQPPEKWLMLEEEYLTFVPETEGVFQLLNVKKEVIYIKGTLNLRKDLQQQIPINTEAKYFLYEEAKMYTLRENEILQQYIKRYGKMPKQNLEIEEDLY
jgi:NADPH-dependent glutamate synthase beta subunit-like oxidoreductase